MASLIRRGSIYYIQYMNGGAAFRRSTGTDVLQIAKEELRQFESDRARNGRVILPTRTRIADVLTPYVENIRCAKTPKSAQTDIYYLRDAFGPIVEGLKVTSRRLSAATKKRPAKLGQDRRRKAPVIHASHFEFITTAQVSEFIAGRMASRGLSPKTGNRIRDTLSALFSWAMSQRGIKMPGDKNPVTAVKKYKVPDPEISFLERDEIDMQLKVLADDVKMQAAVATLIFAGLRREELLWLKWSDVDWMSGEYGLLRVRPKTVALIVAIAAY